MCRAILLSDEKYDILIHEFMGYDNDKRPNTRNGNGYVHLFDFSFTVKKEGRASGNADLFIDLGFNRFS